jgi:hypothetical protein
MADLETDALEAQQLQNNPLLNRILAEMFQDAVETGISASLTDHELRSAAMAEARATRSFASKLASIIDDAVSARNRKGSPV